MFGWRRAPVPRPDGLAKARAMFDAYRGSISTMLQDGSWTEYHSYRVPKEIERQWYTELVDAWCQQSEQAIETGSPTIVDLIRQGGTNAAGLAASVPRRLRPRVLEMLVRLGERLLTFSRPAGPPSEAGIGWSFAADTWAWWMFFSAEELSAPWWGPWVPRRQKRVLRRIAALAVDRAAEWTADDPNPNLLTAVAKLRKRLG